MPSRRATLLGLAGVGVVAAAAGLFLLRREIVPEMSPAQRGEAVARRAGCFGCHGQFPNRTNGYVVVTTDGERRMGGAADGPRVPGLAARHDLAEVREWIEKGSAEPRSDEDRGALRMPAFKGRLSPQEIDDVVAFVGLHQPIRAAEDAPPRKDVLARGDALARSLGCFTCHGELGQGGVPNPGALKGYVPGFFGSDYDVLTRGREDWVRAWIRDGAPREFLDQGAFGVHPARWFTERSAIRMPPFAPFLKDGELELLVQYCQELHRLGPLDAKDIAAYRSRVGADED